MSANVSFADIRIRNRSSRYKVLCHLYTSYTLVITQGAVISKFVKVFLEIYVLIYG